MIKDQCEKFFEKMTNLSVHTKRLLWFLFVKSKGGFTRRRLILAISKKPRNANQLAKELGLDRRVIIHHIEVLEKNNLIKHDGRKWGTKFFVSAFLDVHREAFNEILTYLEKNDIIYSSQF